MRLLCAAALMTSLAGPAGGAPYHGEKWELERMLRDGVWNERVWAVNELGRGGPTALPAVAKALGDLDWQVRLTAVHWIGRSGPRAEPVLEEFLGRESCPLVRMAAIHWLGNVGEHSARLEDGGPEQGLDRCRSWTWPLSKEYSRARRRRTKHRASTAVDEEGCRYIRFREAGRMVCPEGTILRGVGPSPNAIKMLRGRPPVSGVALCCPPDAVEQAEYPAPVKPPDVECRLLPEECPAPWVEMEPPDSSIFKRKDRRFRRTRKHKRGETIWKHCCRPHGLARRDEPEVERPPEPGPWEEPEVPYSEPVIDDEIVNGAPERDIARRALARLEQKEEEPARTERPPAREPEPEDLFDEPEEVQDEDRLAELDHLLALPFSEGSLEPLPEFPARDEPAYEPEASLEATERSEASLALERADPLQGSPEDLPAPVGPEMRHVPVVRARAEAVESRGAPPPEHDALPALLEMLRHKSARKRARSAEALGAMGAKAEPAVPALKAALKDRSARVRSSAALALGNITRGSDTAVRVLRRALKDPHVDVRYSAALALGRIGTPASQKAFYRHMWRETHRFIRGAPAPR